MYKVGVKQYVVDDHTKVLSPKTKVHLSLGHTREQGEAGQERVQQPRADIQLGKMRGHMKNMTRLAGPGVTTTVTVATMTAFPTALGKRFLSVGECLVHHTPADHAHDKGQ